MLFEILSIVMAGLSVVVALVTGAATFFIIKGMIE
jgi:hypothetical protein